jgi:hypothetical protein
MHTALDLRERHDRVALTRRGGWDGKDRDGDESEDRLQGAPP